MNWIDNNDPSFPSNLSSLMGKDAPSSLHAIGDISILAQPLTAVFCSKKCAGDAILKAYDRVRELRMAGVTFIGGFHSPIEKDCLEILLRGTQPIVICPAKSLEKMRIPRLWKPLIEKNRLLLISPFSAKKKSITMGQAEYRNLFVAALATEILIPYAAPNSKTIKLLNTIRNWNKKIFTFDLVGNKDSCEMGINTIK